MQRLQETAVWPQNWSILIPISRAFPEGFSKQFLLWLIIHVFDEQMNGAVGRLKTPFMVNL